MSGLQPLRRRLVLAGDERHGFRRVENQVLFTAVAEAFLAQHMGGRLEPAGDDFAQSSIEFPRGPRADPWTGLTPTRLRRRRFLPLDHRR
jgi:hypothetical protein